MAQQPTWKAVLRALVQSSAKNFPVPLAGSWVAHVDGRRYSVDVQFAELHSAHSWPPDVDDAEAR